jgi:hypothetical protein
LNLGNLRERFGPSDKLFAHQDDDTMLRPMALHCSDVIRADIARKQRHIFAELANTFTRMLEMVDTARCATQRASTEEVPALYQRCLSTRYPEIENQLSTPGLTMARSPVFAVR